MTTLRMLLRRATCNHWRSQMTVTTELEVDGVTTIEETTTCQWCGKLLDRSFKKND